MKADMPDPKPFTREDFERACNESPTLASVDQSKLDLPPWFGKEDGWCVAHPIVAEHLGSEFRDLLARARCELRIDAHCPHSGDDPTVYFIRMSDMELGRTVYPSRFDRE